MLRPLQSPQAGQVTLKPCTLLVAGWEVMAPRSVTPPEQREERMPLTQLG